MSNTMNLKTNLEQISKIGKSSPLDKSNPISKRFQKKLDSIRLMLNQNNVTSERIQVEMDQLLKEKKDKVIPTCTNEYCENMIFALFGETENLTIEISELKQQLVEKNRIIKKLKAKLA